MSGTRDAGDRGERAAARYLEERGCELLAAQWRCRYGELDLVARSRDGVICFVEVKLRKNAAYGSAASFVDRRKQEKLRAAAQLYLLRHATDLQPRFDVIEVYAPQGENTPEPKIIRLENAF